MTQDITKQMLMDFSWFILGLLLYYFLTLVKVHLIWYIQPRIYRHQSNVFQHYLPDFLKALFDRRKLYGPAFRYIFKGKRDFPVNQGELGKPIRIALNLPKGFTTFLKPYLLFAIIWCVLKLWIDAKFTYEPLKITLGQIQSLIEWISKLPFVEFLYENKGMIFLCYGLLCISIPFLYEREVNSKKIKTYFSQGLIYLSLLANISFFGANVGKISHYKQTELADLKAQVIAIHDSIYKRLAIITTFQDLKDSVLAADSDFVAELDRIQNLIYKTNLDSLDVADKQAFITKLEEHIKQVQPNVTIEHALSSGDDFTVLEKNFPSKDRSFEQYYREKYTVTGSYPGYDSYMYEQSSWNKSEGEKLAGKIKNFTALQSTSPNAKKLEKILGHLFDFGMDLGVAETMDALKLGSHNTLKKVITLVASEPYKERIVRRTIRVLDMLKNKDVVEKRVLEDEKIFSPSPNEDLIAFQKSNNQFYNEQLLIAENKSLEKRVTQQIANLDIVVPEKAEILERLKAYGNYEGVPILTEMDAKSYLAASNFPIDDQLDLKDAIIERERKEYQKIFLETAKDLNLKDYNEFLKQRASQLRNQTSNVTLMNASSIDRFIGMCNGSGALLCARCGLPCAFPVCLTMGR